MLKLQNIAQCLSIEEKKLDENIRLIEARKHDPFAPKLINLKFPSQFRSYSLSFIPKICLCVCVAG